MSFAGELVFEVSLELSLAAPSVPSGPAPRLIWVCFVVLRVVTLAPSDVSGLVVDMVDLLVR
ncbi:MAG: hypothetical protein ACJ79M_14565, partial [Myxococcales bacterium]